MAASERWPRCPTCGGTQFEEVARLLEIRPLVGVEGGFPRFAHGQVECLSAVECCTDCHGEVSIDELIEGGIGVQLDNE